MKTSIFEFRSYKPYLLKRLEEISSHGARTQLARALQCQPAYITRILNGDVELSLEQAWLANEFLEHSKEEARFFLLLVQHARAGIAALRKHIESEMDEVIKKRLVLKDRLNVKATLSTADQPVYYSSWHYAAVHILLTIERFRTRDAIASYLDLPASRITEILDFLVSTGLATRDKSGTYGIGASRIHLGSDSPHLPRHHTNWRLRAIDSLDNPGSEDLHYSSVVSISEDDFLKISEVLARTIEDVKKRVKDSPSEKLVCFSLDLFDLKR